MIFYSEDVEKASYYMTSILYRLTNELKYFYQEREAQNITEGVEEYLFRIGLAQLKEKMEVTPEVENYLRSTINEVIIDRYENFEPMADRFLQENLEKLPLYERDQSLMKYNMKNTVIKVLEKMGLSQQALECDALISNVVTTHEEILSPYHFSFAPNVLSRYTDEEIAEKINNIVDEIVEKLSKCMTIKKEGSKEYIIVNNVDISKETLDKYFGFYDYLEQTNDTLIFDSKYKTLTHTKSTNDISYDRYNRKAKILSRMTTETYDQDQRMIFDSEINSGVPSVSLEDIGYPPYSTVFNKYTLQVGYNDNKARYVYTQDDEVLLELDDVEVIYDKIIINFLANEQSEEEYYVDCYGNRYYTQSLCSIWLEKLLTSHNIKHIFHNDDPLFSVSVFDFSKEKMWHKLEGLVMDAKGKPYRKKKFMYYEDLKK